MKTVTANVVLTFLIPDHISVTPETKLHVNLGSLAKIELRRSMALGGFEPIAKLGSFQGETFAISEDEDGATISTVD